MIVQKIKSPKSKAAVAVMRLDTMSVSRIRHCGRTRRNCLYERKMIVKKKKN